jgi:hypothetical protein
MTPINVVTDSPKGRCDCGEHLRGARDLGVVDRYQQHEIPQVAVRLEFRSLLAGRDWCQGWRPGPA